MKKPDLSPLIPGLQREQDPEPLVGPPSLQDMNSRAVCTSIQWHIPVSQGFGVSCSQRVPAPRLPTGAIP